MAYVLADNIISPLGKSSLENYLSVKAGKSKLRAYEPGSMGMQDGFCASLLPVAIDNQGEDTKLDHFEQLVMASARKAVAESGIHVDNPRVVFVLSTTKGAIEELGHKGDEDIYLGATARKIASVLGFHTEPIVVCNACISGLAALILASRLIDEGTYDEAVVCGADSPRRFIISGFQSLKALSSVPCHPFDMDRFGLNLGEAAATIVLGKDVSTTDKAKGHQQEHWQMGRGYIRNDAFHISAPSKTSEGLYACLTETLRGISPEALGLVNAHGTATLFNDQMESVAIQRAGLSDVPTNALKGYFGHTLGAAGILETILCMKALDDHIIIGTRGFEELGVSGKVNISASHRTTDKHSFIKMLSGFGGCNATMLITKEPKLPETWEEGGMSSSNGHHKDNFRLERLHHVKLSPKRLCVDGKPMKVNMDDKDSSMLTAIYKQYVGGYPKFYKMDGLSRLGFVASELLLKAEKSENDTYEKETSEKLPTLTDRAVILFNRTSSIASDKKYLASIADQDNYFPSPSIFVYTLPNIVMGEIAIRNGYHGETSFYVLAEKNEKQMKEVLQTAFWDKRTQSALTGWLDYVDDAHFEADIYIVERQKNIE